MMMAWIMSTITKKLVFNSEHQELLKHIQETENANVRENLERELDRLVAQMEVKGEQISKLKKHQENVRFLRSHSRTDCVKLTVSSRNAANHI